MRELSAFTLLGLLLILVSSCKPKQNMVYMKNHNFEQEVSQARYEGLKLQESDVLEIVITAFDEMAVKPFNRTSMNQSGEEASTQNRTTNNEYIVQNDGTIQLPVLGHVFARGLTKEQLKADLQNRLKTYLTDPMVSIRLVNFNISILGDVKSPGQKTSTTERLNVFQAISLAGDLNDSANRTNVKILRYDPTLGKDVVTSLDLSEASIVNSPYYYLQQNDILYVEPDTNKQIAANATNPNRNLIMSIGGALLGLVTLIIAISK